MRKLGLCEPHSPNLWSPVQRKGHIEPAQSRCVAWQNVGLRRHHEKKVVARIRQGECIAQPYRKTKLFPSKSLAALLDKYLQYLAVKGFTESTLRVRGVHMEMFLTWCRKNRISAPVEVIRTTLESYQRYLFHYRKRDGQPLAVTSQHSRLAPLKVWFKWLTRCNFISEDPASELEVPRVGYKLPNVLNKDEAELVLKQPKLEEPLGIRDRAILEFLYSTGIRRMELLHLKLYDVDQKHGLVTIREGKGKRDRVVPVGEPPHVVKRELVRARGIRHLGKAAVVIVGVIHGRAIRIGLRKQQVQLVVSEEVEKVRIRTLENRKRSDTALYARFRLPGTLNSARHPPRSVKRFALPNKAAFIRENCPRFACRIS